MSLPTLLKTWRQGAGLTIAQAAAALKVQRTTVHAWESLAPTGYSPSLRHLEALCTLYGVSRRRRLAARELLAVRVSPAAGINAPP